MIDDLEGRIARIEDGLSQIVGVLQQVCQKMDAMDDEIDQALSSKVYGRLDGLENEFGSFIGGMNDILDGRKKREYADSFRSSHPEFGQYENFGKSLGIDVYDTAASNTFGMSDEDREKAIADMLAELSSKFDAVKAALDTLNAHESTETPAQEAAEQGEGSESDSGTPGGGIAIEVETAHKPSPDIVKAAQAFKAARANK